jgi:hypothetical protein
MGSEMKSFFTRSWKTTLWGFVIAIGQYLVLAPLANVRWLGDWTNGDNRHLIMRIGVAVAVAGCVLLGISSRDHNVSSEKAGVKK